MSDACLIFCNWLHRRDSRSFRCFRICFAHKVSSLLERASLCLVKVYNTPDKYTKRLERHLQDQLNEANYEVTAQQLCRALLVPEKFTSPSTPEPQNQSVEHSNREVQGQNQKAHSTAQLETSTLARIIYYQKNMRYFAMPLASEGPTLHSHGFRTSVLVVEQSPSIISWPTGTWPPNVNCATRVMSTASLPSDL